MRPYRFGPSLLALAAACAPAAALAQPAGATRAQLPPAANLRVAVVEAPGTLAAPPEPAAPAWDQATPTALLLSHTPRIYQTEPPAPTNPPAAEARAIRSAGKLFVRLRWDDPTRDAPEAPPAKSGDGGDPAVLYKRPTDATDRFADAAAVMVPRAWSGPGFPSLQMGDPSNPVRIYAWNAARGAEVVEAAGRTTTTRTGAAVPHRAEHADGRWTVVLELPDPPAGSPVAFALWDGQHADRDGLKWYSVWYVWDPSPSTSPGGAAR